MSGSGPQEAPDLRARWLVWAVWLLMTGIALVTLALYGRDVPLTEDWLLVPPLTGHEPDLLSWLWEQNNEHRVPLPKLLLLGLLRLSGGDFRAGMLFNVVALSALAAALIVTARRVRGRQRAADAALPLLLLHLGQWENLYWSWQITFVVSVVLVGVLLVLVLRERVTASPGEAAVAGACLTALPLCGGTGLLFVPPLGLWLAVRAALAFRTGRGRPAAAGVLLGGVGAALGVALPYFVDYERPGWTPENPGVLPSLRAAAQAVTLGLGPAARSAWYLGAAAAAILLTAAATLTVVGCLRRQGSERLRAMGLLVFLLTTVAFALAVGWGRAGVIALYGGWPIRYVLLAAPVYCAAYFALDRYATRGRGVLGFAYIAGLILLLPANTEHGFRLGRWYLDGATAVEHDAGAGASEALLADRHREFLYHSWPPREIQRRIAMLREAGIGPFAAARPAADGTVEPRVVRHLRYRSAHPGRAWLVWGIDGWKPMPAAELPTGTVPGEAGTEKTPMARDGDDLVAVVEVPQNARVEFGFLLDPADGSAPGEWVEHREYRFIARTDGVTHVPAPPVVVPADSLTQRVRYSGRGARRVDLWWSVTPPNGGAGAAPSKSRRAAMIREGDAFVADLRVPEGAALEYSFHVTWAAGGLPVDVWDDNGWRGFRAGATGDAAVTIRATIPPAWLVGIADLSARAGYLVLLTAGMAALVLAVQDVRSRRAHERTPP